MTHDKHDHPDTGSLSGLLRRGVKELPKNASWIVAKALRPLGQATNGAPPDSTLESVRESAKDRFRAVGAKARDVMPGVDSVEQRVDRARAAADRTQQAEEEAVATAQTAKQEADRLKAIQAEEKSRIRKLKEELDQRVRAAEADARRRAEEQVDEEKEAARRDADAVLDREQHDSEQRMQDHRDRADNAKGEAEEKLRRATQLMAEARELADEASEAGRQAARQAQEQVDRLVAHAQHDAHQAEELRQRAKQVDDSLDAQAATITRQHMGRFPNATALRAMNKTELMDLAAAQDVDGRASMTKQQLIQALTRATR